MTTGRRAKACTPHNLAVWGDDTPRGSQPNSCSPKSPLASTQVDRDFQPLLPLTPVVARVLRLRCPRAVQPLLTACGSCGPGLLDPVPGGAATFSHVPAAAAQPSRRRDSLTSGAARPLPSSGPTRPPRSPLTGCPSQCPRPLCFGNSGLIACRTCASTVPPRRLCTCGPGAGVPLPHLCSPSPPPPRGWHVLGPQEAPSSLCVCLLPGHTFRPL